MAETQSCPQCGAELSGGGTDLYCPACLMKLGFESCAGQCPAASLLRLNLIRPAGKRPPSKSSLRGSRSSSFSRSSE